MTDRMAERGVIWDLDGVLVDTGELHYLSWSRVLPEYGVPFDRESFRATFGMNNAAILAILLGRTPEPTLLTEISERKEQMFRQAARGNVSPLPGVRPWLERLQSAGFGQAIASSAPQANIDTLVDELGLRPSSRASICWASQTPPRFCRRRRRSRYLLGAVSSLRTRLQGWKVPDAPA